MHVPYYIQAVVAGIATHLGVFIRGEWHLLAPLVALAHTLAFWALFLACASTSPRKNDAASLLQATCLSISYLVGLFGSMSIYRLFFHRLRKFPGPRIAALTKLWHVYECRDLRNHLKMHELYQRYGSFVRTGPEEITVFHPEIFEAMDGPGNNNTRSAWYDNLKPLISPIFSRTESEHREYLRPWNQALSAKAIKGYVPRILNQIQHLQQAIARYDGGPVPINDVMPWFAFDSMGEFAFNQSFDMLKNGKWHSVLTSQYLSLTIQGLLHPAVWAMRLAIACTFIMPVWHFKDAFAMAQFSDDCMKKRMKTKPEQPDMAYWFIKEFEDSKDTTDLRTRQLLLSGNTITCIIGGSDTVGPSLVALWYFLALYPEHARKIQDELGEVDVRDPAALATLPHLNGVMNESIRLLPPGLSMGSRKTPANGLVIGGTYIPGNVTIVSPRYTISRLESAYEDPLSFIPERWYSRPEMVRDVRAFAPYGTGEIKM
ncbi:Tryprostatin B 6-hydroxylase [Cytospora mali]|uniref:Tryprostatin B 6-hydroxylase n=1 Tax=Cytospora mali TaxID=578113 RepID=A0A194WC87_CYTMA|nr:Tryprostatin B 6-hydroxylase [Valsa mali]